MGGGRRGEERKKRRTQIKKRGGNKEVGRLQREKWEEWMWIWRCMWMREKRCGCRLGKHPSPQHAKILVCCWGMWLHIVYLLSSLFLIYLRHQRWCWRDREAPVAMHLQLIGLRVFLPLLLAFPGSVNKHLHALFWIRKEQGTWLGVQRNTHSQRATSASW